MGVSLYIADLLACLIGQVGYAAVFWGMVLESMVFPVPSEAVMPFAGFVIAEGNFTWLGILLTSTFGSVAGSLISYAIGRYGGRPFIDRYGKYFLLDRGALARAEKYFAEKGGRTIFLCRFIPVVRHVSSLPAGIGKMPLGAFVGLTALGAALWNMFLAVVGFYLRNHWARVLRYSEIVDLLVLIMLIAGLSWLIYKKKKRF